MRINTSCQLFILLDAQVTICSTYSYKHRLLSSRNRALRYHVFRQYRPRKACLQSFIYIIIKPVDGLSLRDFRLRLEARRSTEQRAYCVYATHQAPLDGVMFVQLGFLLIESSSLLSRLFPLGVLALSRCKGQCANQAERPTLCSLCNTILRTQDFGNAHVVQQISEQYMIYGPL